MEIPVLRDVLAQLPKFDYILFDACFMQSIEVAYELRHQADWMIGSPAEIPGPGAPYDSIMGALCTGDANGIINGYNSGYPMESYPGALLSCIDCTQLEALAQATKHFLLPFYQDQSLPSTEGFQAYCTKLSMFTHCYDMRTTMCRLLSEEDYAAWMKLFDRTVPLRTYTKTWNAAYCHPPQVNDSTCYGGVSMFVPMEEYEFYGWNKEFQKTSWYAAMGWPETGW